jgi:hypothetical protein
MPVGTAAPTTFDVARRRLDQQSASNKQESTDAIQRRFAALGGLNSGSSLKAQQMAQDQADSQKQNQMDSINAAEADDAARKQEAQTQRDFASAEAEKQRGFQKEQSGIDRAFQDKVFSFDSSSKLKQLDMMGQELAMKNKATQHQIETTGGLFGGGGFLGLGI